MEKAHLHLIKYALRQGCTVSVDGGGDELDLVDGDKFEQIKDEVEAVDDATMLINKDGEQVGWAYVVLWNTEPEELVSDYSVSSFMEAWEKEYYPNNKENKNGQ